MRSQFWGTRTKYSEINSKLGWFFISHTLLTNDLLVLIEEACMNSNGRLRYIHEDDIIFRVEARKRAKNPLKIVTGERRRPKQLHSIVPDGLFGIELMDKPKPDKPNENYTAYFFIEADRGTLTQQKAKRSDREDGSENLEKFITYYHWFDTDKHRKDYWDEFNFRVLFYTTKTEARARNLVDIVEPIYPGGRSQWLFASMDNLLSSENILDAKWLTGKGETVTIP